MKNKEQHPGAILVENKPRTRRTKEEIEREKEEKKRKKEENSAYDLKGAVSRRNDKKKDDVEVEGQGLMLFEDEEYVAPRSNLTFHSLNTVI